MVVLAVLNPRGALAQVDSCWLFNVMDTGSTLSLSLSLSLLRALSLPLPLSLTRSLSLSLSLSNKHLYPGVLRRPERLVCQEERGTPQNFACQNGHKSLMQRLGPFARHDGDKCIINIFGPTQCTFLIDTFDVEKEICATKLQYITHIFM